MVELSLSLRQDQRLQISLEQKLEHRLAMQQQMQGQIRETRSEAIGNVADGLRGVVGEILETAEIDKNIKNFISAMFADDKISDSFIANSSYLLTPKINIEELTARLLYANCFDGNGVIILDNDDGSTQNVKVPAALFIKALLNPEGVEEEAQSLLSLMKDGAAGVGGAAVESIRELNDALRCAEISREVFELWKKLVAFISTYKKDQKDDVPMIISFLQDKVLLEQLDFVITERLADRFADLFMKIGKKATAKNFYNGMTNLVGEYVLVSMGIIDPSIFKTCRSGEIDYLAKLRPDLAKMGIDLGALLKRYGLRGEGTLFWNRYYVKGMVPTAITDELIRDFITKTVRADQQEVIKALKFEEYFEKIKEIVFSKEDDGRNKKEDLKHVCVEMLLDTEFSEYLVKTIKEKWKNHLGLFIKNRSKK